ncbi:MAG: YiiX/YebB-like N1pC/P60 family cysteine hydrolase [Mangrovibacterium sp.]
MDFRFLLLCFCTFFACTTTEELRKGDLLFVEAGISDLSKAINEVTQVEECSSFSHVGILDISSTGELVVLHATSDSGVVSSPLKSFLASNTDNVHTYAYRLLPSYENAIPKALNRAKAMLGMPYNFSYVRNDTSYYCSEFVYLAFESDSIFSLEPMTFKVANSDDFLDLWVIYYEKLGIDIPEGLLGCNPNGLAASHKLMRLGAISSDGKLVPKE